MYGLTLVTGPTAEPVSLAEAKDHLRISDAAADGILTGYLLAARQHLETTYGIALAAQTFDLVLDDLPCSSTKPIELPRNPVQSITSVQYVDVNGATQTWAGANYFLDSNRQPARLLPVSGQPWPTVLNIANAVTVRFVAGYAATKVPEQIRHALLLLVSHFHENREPVNVGNIITPMPMSIDALMASFRTSWFA
jgi:uncharacterized phiE125 gp8 family phage protein